MRYTYHAYEYDTQNRIVENDKRAHSIQYFSMFRSFIYLNVT